MADIFPIQQKGVADGTAIPADRADGRQVGAPVLRTFASKATDEALAAGDRFYLGKKPCGCKVSNVLVTTAVSMGAATFDIGTDADPDKYVDGKGVTTTDVPVSVGPIASTLDDAPSDDEEDLWATVAGATIATATALTIQVEFVGIS